MRKQYHLRPADRGFNAWDVDNLIKLTENLDVVEVNILKLLEKNEYHWSQGEKFPTVKSIFDHMKLVNGCSLEFPIIMSADGIIMDGMHIPITL